MRYAIDSRNRLYVEKTGNRAEVEDVVNELLPKDSCRYIAYNFKYQKGSLSSTRVVWFLWTPPSAPEKVWARSNYPSLLCSSRDRNRSNTPMVLPAH